MPKSSTDRATAPESVWLASGRHTGPAPQNVLRDNLRKLKAAGTIQDFLEAENSAASDEHVFEARWLVADAVTVRARLTTDPREHADEERRWTLAAEAEGPWDAAWPSPQPCSGPRTATSPGTTTGWKGSVCGTSTRCRRTTRRCVAC